MPTNPDARIASPENDTVNTEASTPVLSTTETNPDARNISPENHTSTIEATAQVLSASEMPVPSTSEPSSQTEERENVGAVQSTSNFEILSSPNNSVQNSDKEASSTKKTASENKLPSKDSPSKESPKAPPP